MLLIVLMISEDDMPRSRHRAGTKPRLDSLQKLMNCTTWQEVMKLPDYQPSRTSYWPHPFLEEQADRIQEELIAEETEPVDLAALQSVMDKLKQVLTTEEYEVFTRYYAEEISMRGIAELINKSHVQVKYILDRTEKKVREIFKGWTYVRNATSERPTLLQLLDS